MPGEGNTSRTPGSDGAEGKEGQNKKKIAGKYDTLEEAYDKGIVGLERGFHETREEIGAIKQLLERALTPIGTRGQTDDRDDSYGRGRRTQEDEYDFDETEFIASPKKVLKQREDRMTKKITDELARRNGAMINNASQVLRWQMQNPDLDEHEPIVESFYKKTDPNKSTYDRLKEAGKQTRAYLKKLKGTEDDEERNQAGRSPTEDEYVEGAAGAGRGNKEKPKGDEDEGKPSDIYGDAELAQEIEERRRFKASRFQAKSAK